MQTLINETLPPVPFLSGDAEFEFLEPKRVVISPLELCLLSEPDDLFEDD